MKGKKTNVFLGILNIMLGILLIIYVFYMMSNNRLELTRHQRFVINIQHNIIFGVTIVVSIINLIFSLFSLVGLVTFFAPSYIYPIFVIGSGILIIRTLSKNNYIEKDNFLASTIILIMMGVLVVARDIISTI